MLTLTKKQRDIILWLESREGEHWSRHERGTYVDASRHSNGIFGEIKEDSTRHEPNNDAWSWSPGFVPWWCSISCVCADCVDWEHESSNYGIEEIPGTNPSTTVLHQYNDELLRRYLLMRSLWSGALNLSLLNVPVKLGSATKDNALGLRMVRKSDGSQIRFTRVAEVDGKEVAWSDIGKGYDAPDGSLVILDNADFEQAYGPKNRVAEILMATDAAHVPPLAVRTSYYVEPGKGGEKTYALLSQALEASGKVLVLTFAMRQREALAVLRPLDGYLVLQSLEWHADLLKPDFEAPTQTATEAEQELALKLIDQMTGEFKHADYADTSTEALQGVIQGKLETGQVMSAPARSDSKEPAAKYGDLMGTLTAAIQAKGGSAPEVPAARKPRTTRKASA